MNNALKLLCTGALALLFVLSTAPSSMAQVNCVPPETLKIKGGEGKSPSFSTANMAAACNQGRANCKAAFDAAQAEWVKFVTACNIIQCTPTRTKAPAPVDKTWCDGSAKAFVYAADGVNIACQYTEHYFDINGDGKEDRLFTPNHNCPPDVTNVRCKVPNPDLIPDPTGTLRTDTFTCTGSQAQADAVPGILAGIGDYYESSGSVIYGDIWRWLRENGGWTDKDIPQPPPRPKNLDIDF